MPAKPSGEVKTKTIHQTQKNGDIYVLERQTIYDPEKKYNKVLSTKLIAKIPKDGKIPVPTRPKRSKGTKSGSKTEIISANRVKNQRIIGFFYPCIIAVPYQGTQRVANIYFVRDNLSTLYLSSENKTQ